MTQERATDVAQRPDPVFGVSEAAEDILGALVTDANDLSEGGMSDINATIIGFDYKQGGETQKRQDGTEFITPDQIQMHLRVDNADDLGLENDTTVQYFSLPKASVRDGVVRRGKPTRTSAYGIWLASLAALGVSSAREDAHEFLIENGLRDLIGLQFHRKREAFETYNGGEMTVQIPVALYGFDNAFRKEQKLPAAKLISQG